MTQQTNYTSMHTKPPTNTTTKLALLSTLASLIFSACTHTTTSPVITSGEQSAPTHTAIKTQPITPTTLRTDKFDGERALADIDYQLSVGPRIPGSKAHTQVVKYIDSTLSNSGWEVSIQETNIINQPITNIIGKWGEGRPWVILGAHYDTRMVADRDPDPGNHQKPVPGANDGASGVAVLLELARILPSHATDLRFGQVWLVFFDAEDNGNLPGRDWVLGSRAFVNSLSDYPDSAVIVDMVGDVNQDIYQEAYSDPTLTAEIWETAATLGYSNRFIPEIYLSIIDDHLPFIEAGIPAIDIIDIKYPYWHTVEDTIDKLSSDSLMAVGDTLLAWLTTKRN